MELLDGSHVGTGGGGDTVLGDPDGLVEGAVDGLDPLLELLDVLGGAVPVDGDKVDGASELVALLHEFLQPLGLVDHLGELILTPLRA